jgi:thioredoxin 1
MKMLSPEDFEGDGLKMEGRVGVLFYAGWCPFCTSFKPLFENMAQDGLVLTIADISDEENPLWDDFRVQIVPTIVAFKEGREIWRKDGVPARGLKREDLEAMVDALKT